MASPYSNESTTLGSLRPQDVQGSINPVLFAVKRLLEKMQTATLVKVISCTNSGGVSAVGTVNVQPMVNMIDGSGNGTEHGTIYALPYFRLQGGSNAMIVDPVTGDIGIAIFCSRDISSVKSSKTVSNPGSFRKFDYADGLYIGGFLFGAPTRYVQLSEDGITINDSTVVNITAPTIKLNGEVVTSSSITSSGDITAGSVSLESHKHTTTKEGMPTSGPIA